MKQSFHSLYFILGVGSKIAFSFPFSPPFSLMLCFYTNRQSHGVTVLAWLSLSDLFAFLLKLLMLKLLHSLGR